MPRPVVIAVAAAVSYAAAAVLVAAMLAATGCRPVRSASGHDHDASGDAPPKTWVVGSEWWLKLPDADGTARAFEFQVTDRRHPRGDAWFELETVTDTRPAAAVPPPRAIARVRGRELVIDLMPDAEDAGDRLVLEISGFRVAGVREIRPPSMMEPAVVAGVSGWRSHDPAVPGLSGLRRKRLKAEPVPADWTAGAEWTFEVTWQERSAERIVFVVTDREGEGHDRGRCVYLDPPAGREQEFWFPQGCVDGRVLFIDLLPEMNHAFDYLEGELDGGRFRGVRFNGVETDFGSDSTAVTVEGWRSR